jgi:hypothetical protein
MAAWVIGAMTHARGDILPGWRAGILILGLYAMFLQAFLAGLAGPAHAHGPAAPGDAGGICVTGVDHAPQAGEAPAAPQTFHACVCPTMCHAAGALPVAGAPFTVRLAFLSAVHSGVRDVSGAQTPARLSPPARAPPHAGFVLQS